MADDIPQFAIDGAETPGDTAIVRVFHDGKWESVGSVQMEHRANGTFIRVDPSTPAGSYILGLFTKAQTLLPVSGEENTFRPYVHDDQTQQENN